MKNLIVNLGEFIPNSQRSLAAALKASLIAAGKDPKVAHEKGWEMAREISKEHKTFNKETVTRHLSEATGEKKKVTGDKPDTKEEVKLSAAAQRIVDNDKLAVNAKIRALFGEKLDCAQIRKALNIAYQRVKNVEKRMQKNGALKN